MKSHVFVLMFTLAGAFALARPAFAQVAETDDEARTLYSLGESAFEQGRFQAAVDYFQQAYDLSHRPQLLYNIGQAADRLRLDARALAAFEGYLAALPNVENRRVVEARIEILRRAVAASQPATPPVVTTTPTPTPREVAEADATQPAPAPSNAASSNGRSATGGWVVASAGAGALVVGAIVLALGARDYNAVTDAPAGSSWDSVEDAHDRASTRITVGSVLLGVGAAAGATGLVLALSADGDDDDAATGALELHVVPTGFVVRRTF